jgi:hypothetical protein
MLTLIWACDVTLQAGRVRASFGLACEAALVH